MRTIIKNYEIKQFSTFTETIKLINENYSPRNLTNWIIYGKVQNFYETNQSVYINCTITNPLLGEFTISLNNINTSRLSSGNYVYDISAQLPDGTINRIQSGTVIVTYGVTNVLSTNLPPQFNGNSLEEFIDGGIV